MKRSIIHNGILKITDDPLLSAYDIHFPHPHGIFETMKVENGKILLDSLHFERLFNGISMLGLKKKGGFTQTQLADKIKTLCEKNNCVDAARARITVVTVEAGRSEFNYFIECASLEPAGNNIGLVIDIYEQARKPLLLLSNLKNTAQPEYVAALQHAKQQKLDECIIRNSKGFICDAGISNVFIVSDHTIYTPPLSEGCVAGVMRRFIMEKVQGTRDLPTLKLRQAGKAGKQVEELRIMEKELEVGELEAAQEIFLTNAIQGIRWVRQFRGKTYVNDVSEKLSDFISNQLS